MKKNQGHIDEISPMRCRISGIGAWGPGFSNWAELRSQLGHTEKNCKRPATKIETASPRPEIIPANERRRAPLPVKIAIEASTQALNMSGLDPASVACVFGSGLGDTEITDYMCRAVNAQAPKLSPTKFHNSVHNAAAGYWTISTKCMKSANSIAGYTNTVGLCLLEGISICLTDSAPVLITVFDAAASNTYRELFDCQDSFAAAILISPEDMISNKPDIATLSIRSSNTEHVTPALANSKLDTLCDTNPAAKMLLLLEQLVILEENEMNFTNAVSFGISSGSDLACTLFSDDHSRDKL
ncbi:beta-ketoacyl synthase chain length factor [Halioglobus sp.]|nr:beta-ketoacyl synthase chain length factor [Halioglobus sp.]